MASSNLKKRIESFGAYSPVLILLTPSDRISKRGLKDGGTDIHEALVRAIPLNLKKRIERRGRRLAAVRLAKLPESQKED